MANAVAKYRRRVEGEMIKVTKNQTLQDLQTIRKRFIFSSKGDWSYLRFLNRQVIQSMPLKDHSSSYVEKIFRIARVRRKRLVMGLLV
jgi:hypothetical protein